MRATGGENNTAVIVHIAQEQVEQQEVTQAVGREGLLEPLSRILGLPHELRPCIEQEHLQRCDGAFANHHGLDRCSPGTYGGQRSHIDSDGSDPCAVPRPKVTRDGIDFRLVTTWQDEVEPTLFENFGGSLQADALVTPGDQHSSHDLHPC